MSQQRTNTHTHTNTTKIHKKKYPLIYDVLCMYYTLCIFVNELCCISILILNTNIHDTIIPNRTWWWLQCHSESHFPLFLFLRFNCFQYSPKHFPIPSYHHLDRTMLVLYHVSQPSILLPKKLSCNVSNKIQYISKRIFHFHNMLKKLYVINLNLTNNPFIIYW